MGDAESTGESLVVRINPPVIYPEHRKGKGREKGIFGNFVDRLLTR